MAQQLVPITRLGKFFGGEDFSLDISMGRMAWWGYEFYHCTLQS